MKQPYPTWILVIAFFLAILSVIPMILVAVLRMAGLLKVDQSQYTAPMRRTDTNASTHPMMVCNQKHDKLDIVWANCTILHCVSRIVAFIIKILI